MVYSSYDIGQYEEQNVFPFMLSYAIFPNKLSYRQARREIPSRVNNGPIGERSEPQSRELSIKVALLPTLDCYSALILMS